MRERIVEAAADQILARGVGGTSLDDVREATSTSKSQLFHYFPGGKAELVREIVACQGARVLGAQSPALFELDSWASWAAWRDAVVEYYTSHDGQLGCPIGSLANHAATGDEALRLQIRDYFEAWRRHLRDGIERMQRGGLVRAHADPDALSTSLLASIQGGLVLAQAGGDLSTLAAALDGALAGLRAHALRQ